MMNISMEFLLENSAKQVEIFQQRIVGVPYETKGVLFSEMFFIFSLLESGKPQQLLESGRARGQSTHVLGLCFPDSRIVSLEHNPNSADVPIAAARLAGLTNVTPLFGDAVKLLPKLLQQGDGVIIDGPKGFRALRLALRLLISGKPAVVFVHDCCQGTPERDFLERYFPRAFFSDHPDFVEKYGFLDQQASNPCEKPDPEDWQPYQFFNTQQKSYGFTFACLPCIAGCDYRVLYLKVILAGFFGRIKDTLHKANHRLFR